MPKVMDAILLNILTYAREGKCLYGRAPCTYTRCQEKYDNYQTLVGCFGPSCLIVSDDQFGRAFIGLSGSWKF